MIRLKKIYSHRATFILVWLLHLFVFADSCQLLEFEPTDILYVTTDSIQLIDQDKYRVSGSVVHIGQQEITQHGFCWSYTGTPTTEGSAVELGSRDSIGTFSSIVSGLELKTTYFVRAYAKTNAGTKYGNTEYFHTLPPIIDPTVKDIDGNLYNVVVIGDQAWMAENLRTTHYADGSAIPYVKNNDAWNALNKSGKAFCWYDNDISNASYGAYYTWSTAMNEEGEGETNEKIQGVCPDGWHIPSDAEWNEMHIQLGMRPDEADNIGFIGTRQSVGDKMKGIGDPLWESLRWNNNLYNQSGFSALPVGQRNNSGLFSNVEKYAYFWSSTKFNDSEAWYRYLQRGHPAVLRAHSTMLMGFSVRCVLN